MSMHELRVFNISGNYINNENHDNAIALSSADSVLGDHSHKGVSGAAIANFRFGNFLSESPKDL